MNFLSTRGRTPPTAIDAALSAGLAPDGGLYVPERFPPLAQPLAGERLADTAHAVLAPLSLIHI